MDLRGALTTMDRNTVFNGELVTAVVARCGLLCLRSGRLGRRLPNELRRSSATHTVLPPTAGLVVVGPRPLSYALAANVAGFPTKRLALLSTWRMSNPAEDVTQYLEKTTTGTLLKN
ncbi:hypothetical protein Voc01_053230 [Virgisporangium ochraceum]|uniref:Uncharacterized protein n=1 Tax=Virgisporangium ochraceum TaxID=65505 RepID=A0A8J4ED68_9ACTN|nr:hypothetical protein Voc01_053230 [Virgisporangium ochraceum]